MILSTILFNPHARVYNLRFLLLAAIASTALHAYNRVHWRHNENSIPLWLSMFFSLFVPVHHLAVLFRWPGNWRAIVDLAISTIEIGVTGNIIYYIYDNQEMTLDTPVPVICLLIALLVAAVFRAATMYTSKDRLCEQQFDLLGGCALVMPAYTPWTILHHRFPVIVAFVRERLVDLGNDPRASTGKGELGDVETQIASPICDAAERGAGTASEKIPLLG
ncbi:hypothetical protein DFH08DRAFT_847230 [Mycena albidolilacea]|uniref:Uncharacterized protein n=1 Tax=Mycena albidolilacea TaxID=1033008 RepID=A0AAD7F1R1_9AGAR|nr:hypothetical protein DFH08DRAFT_847230 [Mycena albidolilacea]